MPQWPKNESATGRGFTQGSDSYRPDDVAREDLERSREEKEKENQKFTGTDDLHKDPDDPNFGDYNIPPGGNHP